MIADFIKVTTQEKLQEYYPLIEDCCKRITRTGFPAFAPDVYAALLTNKAQMTVAILNDVPIGFFTTYVVEHPCQPSQLHIWHGYIVPGQPKDRLGWGFDALGKLAKELGCSQLVFGTRRKGWAKHAHTVGMNLKEYTFFKGV